MHIEGSIFRIEVHSAYLLEQLFSLDFQFFEFFRINFRSLQFHLELFVFYFSLDFIQLLEQGQFRLEIANNADFIDWSKFFH